MKHLQCINLCAVLYLTTGCSVPEKDVPCAESSDCDLAPGGVCKPSAAGNQWCAYPDGECPSGLRFSEANVGDSVAGTCTELETFTLHVTVGGSVSGTVSSAPDGLVCSDTSCEQAFPIGTNVELTTQTATGAFLGWSDACTGFSRCMITMDSDKQVGALFGTPGQALWVQHAGAVGDDLGRGIAADGDEAIVVVGDFRNTIDLGGTPLTSSGGTDIFLAKLDPMSGAVLWAKRFGGSGDDAPTGVVVDAGHNIYMSGSFTDTIDFGDGPLPFADNPDGFVAKIRGDGSSEWSKAISGPAYNFARNIAVRGSNVVVVGDFQQTATINGTSYTASGQDVFVVSYGPSGVANWVKTVGGSGSERPEGVAIDSDGNVVVVGTFSGTSGNLGGSTITGAGATASNSFIAKYAGPNGAHLFSKRLGGGPISYATDVAVDANDGIFVVGSVYGVEDFGGATPLGSDGVSTMYLVKLNLAGAFTWGRSFGVPGKIQGFAVTANAAGDVAVAGGFCGTVSLGGATLTSVRTCAESDQDIFAARFSGATGDHITSIRAGGVALDDSRAIVQLSDGRVFLTGGFQGFAEFGGEALNSAGGYDAVVLGLAPL